MSSVRSRTRLLGWVAGWVVGLVAFRLVVVPPESCSPPSRDDLDETATAAAAWGLRAVLPDGQFVYGYHRDRAELSEDYNDVRHAAMTAALYRWAAVEAEPDLTEIDRSLAWMLDRLVDTGDGTAVVVPGDWAKIGTSALLALALVERRDLTGDETQDPIIEGLGRFLVAQQEPDGRMLGFWDPRRGEPVPGRTSLYGTGEAFYAMAMLRTRFPAADLDAATWRLADYVAGERRAREGELVELPDHWAAYAFAELAAHDPDRLTDAHTDYLRRLAGEFATMTRIESTRTPGSVYATLRGGHALGAGVGALGEGIAGVAAVARTDARLADLAAPLEDHLACVTDLLVERQATAGPAQVDAGLVDGAWFRRDYTQVDDQQHSLSALLLAGAEPARPDPAGAAS